MWFDRLACLVLVFFVGCTPMRRGVEKFYATAVEIPALNLPMTLREENWVSREGHGSCVHASTVMNMRWQNQLELANKWRLDHSGGETANSIQKYLRDAGVPFRCTENSDESFLEWATRTRRGAIIWFYPSHCVLFCGFSKDEKGADIAILLDNNAIEKYIAVPRAVFLQKWEHEYGGFALSVLGSPVPPPLFQGWRFTS